MTEIVVPDEPLGVARPVRERKIRAVAVEDPDERPWRQETRRRWKAAERQTPEEPFAVYDPVPLPDWNASRSASVGRDLLGRFLQDRDTGIVHDCYAATEECGVDGIRNGTFFHFWAEVLDHLQDDVPCPNCIP